MSTPILQNLLDLLRPLSIYRITEDSMIRKELNSYAAGFALLQQLLERNLREGFLQTAEEEGVLLREGALGGDFSHLPPEERRTRLMYLTSVLPGAIQMQQILNAFRALGFTGDLRENREEEHLLLTDVSPESTPEGYRWLVSAAERLLPAHLAYSFDLPAYRWEQLDGWDFPFYRLDRLEFRWNLFAD